MASITSWVRLEPRARDPELGPGVEARLHDPLWLIGRQWQLGELTGHDAGSAIESRAEVELARVDAVRGGDTWHPFDPERDVLAGATLAASSPPDLAERARSGRRLTRALLRAGEVAAAEWLVGEFPLTADPTSVIDDADRRFLALVAGRIPDGAAAAAVLAPQLAGGDLPATFAMPTTDRSAASAACRAWLASLDARITRSIDAWRAPALRHHFELRASNLRLSARDHGSDAIAWHAVDAATDPQTPIDPTAPSPVTESFVGIPTRIRYRGMPARRYWDLEDATVYWPGVEAGPGDVGRVLLVEFAHSYSDHWLAMPLVVKAGTVARVTSLVVIDTFGRRSAIAPAADAAWRFCELTPVAGAAPSGLVFLPPIASDLVGRPRSVVELGRDDTSNVVWAIDRVRAGADGRSREVAVPPPISPPSRTADAPALAYRLGPVVPEPCHPYRPVMRPEGIALVRAIAPGQPPTPDRIDLPDHLEPGAVGALVVRVALTDHVARSADGAYHVYTVPTAARAATAGSAPVLAFDQLEDRS